MAQPANLAPSVTRFNQINALIAFSGRPVPLLSISGTTSSSATAIPASDAYGTLGNGFYMTVQAAVGTGGAWINWGDVSVTADATCLFIPENYQQQVYILQSDTYIAVKNSGGSGIVNVFSMR